MASLPFCRRSGSHPRIERLSRQRKEAARIEQYQRELFGETAVERVARERTELLARLYAAYGLKIGPPNPTPIEPQVAATVVVTKESPAEAGLGIEPSEDSK